MWKYENGLFDYLISEVCFSFIYHLCLASSSILLLWFCLSVSMGALDTEGDTRPSALSRLGHTTSLKRGGSLRIPRSNSECHCLLHFLRIRGGFSVSHLTLLLFVYVLPLMPHTVLQGNITTIITVALPGSWNSSVILCRLCAVDWNIPCLCVAAWRYETPQQVQFVEKLSDVVIGQLPNFWKLWISYVNGSLFSEVNTRGAFTRHWHVLEVDTGHLFRNVPLRMSKGFIFS